MRNRALELSPRRAKPFAELDQQEGFSGVFGSIRHTLMLAELAEGTTVLRAPVRFYTLWSWEAKEGAGIFRDELRDGFQQLIQLRTLVPRSASPAGAAGVVNLRSTKTAEHAASCTRDLMGQFPSTPASGESHSQERAIAIRCRSSCQLVPLLIAFSASTTANDGSTRAIDGAGRQGIMCHFCSHHLCRALLACSSLQNCQASRRSHGGACAQTEKSDGYFCGTCNR